jgi:hypothetical protein
LVVECQKPKTDMLRCCCSAAETDAMFLNMFDKLFVFVVFSIICVLVLFLYTKWNTICNGYPSILYC